jgi:uncharacterized SAM-binding protein YcdF (DUF218 family)
VNSTGLAGVGRLAVRVALAAAIFMAAAYAFRAPILGAIGAQLVHADPLVRSDAIVVLAGGTPQREIEAADLYVAGWAPRVLMTSDGDSPAFDELRKRGFKLETDNELKKRILLTLGVPETALTIFADKANSTKGETELVKAWLASNRARRIIVVTSPFHTARARMVFRRALREDGVEVLTHPASHEPFDADNWWKDRNQLRNGIFEWQKLLLYSMLYR